MKKLLPFLLAFGMVMFSPVNADQATSNDDPIETITLSYSKLDQSKTLDVPAYVVGNMLVFEDLDTVKATVDHINAESLSIGPVDYWAQQGFRSFQTAYESFLSDMNGTESDAAAAQILKRGTHLVRIVYTNGEAEGVPIIADEGIATIVNEYGWFAAGTSAYRVHGQTITSVSNLTEEELSDIGGLTNTAAVYASIKSNSRVEQLDVSLISSTKKPAFDSTAKRVTDSCTQTYGRKGRWRVRGDTHDSVAPLTRSQKRSLRVWFANKVPEIQTIYSADVEALDSRGCHIAFIPRWRGDSGTLRNESRAGSPTKPLAQPDSHS